MTAFSSKGITAFGWLLFRQPVMIGMEFSEGIDSSMQVSGVGLWAVMVALASFAMAPRAVAQSEAEASADVADQVRDQGYKCGEPAKATRDAADSAPELPVWILQCADAKYRVRIVPDQGAEIDPVE